MSRLTRYEQETIINFNEGEDTMSVYTHNRPLIHRLEKLAQERPEECYSVNTYPIRRAVEYYVPKSWVQIKPPRKLSEKQLEQIRAASKSTRFAKKDGGDHGAQDTPAAETGNYISQPLGGEKAVQPVYIVEWSDHEGNQRQRAFDSREAAEVEAAALEKEFDHVAILWEEEV